MKYGYIYTAVIMIAGLIEIEIYENNFRNEKKHDFRLFKEFGVHAGARTDITLT